jgi:hypothetical protein
MFLDLPDTDPIFRGMELIPAFSHEDVVRTEIILAK